MHSTNQKLWRRLCAFSLAISLVCTPSIHAMADPGTADEPEVTIEETVSTGSDTVEVITDSEESSEEETPAPPEEDPEPVKNGWEKIDSQWFYYKDGSCCLGDQKIDGVWYYFNTSTGVMAANSFVKNPTNGKWYYYGPTGALVYGDRKVDGVWYYFSTTNGAMVANSFVKNPTNGKWYYYGPTGALVYGDRKIDGVWYYFNTTNGAMVANSFVQNPSNRKWYYYGPTGALVYGDRKIDGVWYYFDKTNAAMAANSFIYNSELGKWYYYGANGALYHGQLHYQDKWYYLDTTNGAMAAASFVDLGNKTVYYGADGAMLYGEQTIGDNSYYFNTVSGAVSYGILEVGHYLYNCGTDGIIHRKIDKDLPMVALTYDDGPSANTATILDTLEAYDSVATFFVVGENVSRYATTVNRAYTMGCQIGNHTYNHKTLTKITTTEIQNQLSLTNDVVSDAIGVEPTIMRPPGGGHNATVRATVGMPLILWSIDTLDWKTKNAASTINSVLGSVGDGSIVLMHDLYSATATASQTIIPSLVNSGYQLVTIDELAACRGGMESGTVYYSFRP